MQFFSPQDLYIISKWWNSINDTSVKIVSMGLLKNKSDNLSSEFYSRLLSP